MREDGGRESGLLANTILLLGMKQGQNTGPEGKGRFWLGNTDSPRKDLQ